VTDVIEDCAECEDDFAAVTADDEMSETITPDPRGKKLTRWRGLLAPIGKPTGDGRRFASGSLEHRELPQPLRWQREDQGAHKAAVVIGTMDQVDYTDEGVFGGGVMFDPDPEQLPRLAQDVAEARMLLAQKVIGPSVDLDAMEFRVLPQAESEFADGDGEVQRRPEVEVDKGRISAATLVPIPAFAEARPFELYEVDADAFAAAQPFLTASVQMEGWDALPVADAATEWDPAGALERLREFAADDMGTFASAFLWHDPAALERPGSYRFPLADVVDGELTLVPGAITAASARLDAAQLPAGDKMVMRATLAAIESGEYGAMGTTLIDGEPDAEFADLGEALVLMDEEDAFEVGVLAEELFQAQQTGEEVTDAATYASRFDALAAKLSGHVADAKAVAAKIGRKKYGKKGMERLAEGAKASSVKALSASGYLMNAMVAAATTAPAPVRPPAEWFTTPEPDQRTPLTITPEGRVYGHIADWTTCHTGFSNQCIRAPKSRTSYAYFHTGATLTADGSEIPVGRLSVGGGHADTTLGLQPAVAHYDDASTAVAEIRATDGKHGIWVSGQVLPEFRGTAMEDALRRHPPSGDWRRVAGNLEMIHVLSVNSGGFPVPRMGMAASAATGAGEEMVPVGLVAAGMVVTPEQAVQAEYSRGVVPEEQVRAMVKQAITEYRDQEASAARSLTAATLLAQMNDDIEAGEVLRLREQALSAAALIY
jgi:hypothetical protein